LFFIDNIKKFATPLQKETVMTSLASVFVEIGTEELPAGFLKTVQNALTHQVQSRLDALALAVKAITVEKTPRRLVIRLEGVPEAQAERTEVIKGPPVAMAFQEDGTASKALEGFLRKNNTSLEACTQETIGGTAYMVYRKTQAGQAVKTLIGDLIADSVLSLEGPRFMRWANNSKLFPRPIRWLLGFWNNEPLHFATHLGDEALHSGTTTRGHRLLGEAEIEIKNPQDYVEKLASQGKVILSTQKRMDLVVAQLNEKASELGGRAIIDADLLEEVANILEYPSVIVGRFDEAYLNIPTCFNYRNEGTSAVFPCGK
jgi:glycyl-tRNA synthetase beta chain